jgi:hypothetical protein
VPLCAVISRGVPCRFPGVAILLVFVSRFSLFVASRGVLLQLTVLSQRSQPSDDILSYRGPTLLSAFPAQVPTSGTAMNLTGACRGACFVARAFSACVTVIPSDVQGLTLVWMEAASSSL